MTNHTHHNMGMGLIEMLLSVVIIGSVLGVLTLVSNSLRAQTADQDTRQTLRLLRIAMAHYYDAYQSWPPGPTSQALITLQSAPASKEQMCCVPLVMEQPRIPVIRDGFGYPLTYLPPMADSPHPPDFVSAGPDRAFGDAASDDPRQRMAATDNIYGIDTEKHLR